VILTLIATATALGLLLMRALPSVHPARFALPLLFAAGALALFIKLTADTWVPVPLTSSHNVNAASSLQSTAGDLAKFASELMQPRKLDAEIIRQMSTPQVAIDERDSWGLGIGIQTDSSGTSLWQWGDNPGFQSLLVVYPARLQGVVVMTNSWAGLYLAREFAKTLFNAQGSWKLP
jgi:CubicO group peptidase (beta-lactamase class C family)